MTDSVITREAGDLRRALRAARVGGVVSTLSLLVLLGILTYFVYTLDQRVGELEAELATVGLRVSGLETDVTSLASELYTVGMLARNADNYAHSHYSDLRLKREVAAYHSRRLLSYGQ